MIELAQLNDQLGVYIREKREVEKLQRQLIHIADQRRYIQERMKFIKGRLEEEKADVDRLQNRPIRRLLIDSSPQETAQYQKELAEYETVKEHYDQGLTMLSDLDAEERQINLRLKHIGPVEEHYQELMELKERILRQKGMSSYVDICEQLENRRLDFKELEEARNVGVSLQKLIQHMKRLVDNLFDGEIDDYTNRRTYNTVLGYMRQAQKLGYSFHKEMQEAELRLSIEAPHPSEAFLKIYRDFVDEQIHYRNKPMVERMLGELIESHWNQRMRIARKSLQRYRANMTLNLNFLRAHLQTTQMQLQKLEVEKQRLIEQST